MRKLIDVAFVLLMAGTVMVPPALGGQESLLKKSAPACFAAQLEASLQGRATPVPWLNLDRRSNGLKGDFLFGRYASDTPVSLWQWSKAGIFTSISAQSSNTDLRTQSVDCVM